MVLELALWEEPQLVQERPRPRPVQDADPANLHLRRERCGPCGLVATLRLGPRVVARQHGNQVLHDHLARLSRVLRQHDLGGVAVLARRLFDQLTHTASAQLLALHVRDVEPIRLLPIEHQDADRVGTSPLARRQVPCPNRDERLVG